MDIHFYHDPHGNFGDDLNSWVWDELIPEELRRTPDTVLMGIGTLLNVERVRSLNAYSSRFVMGSGVGYGPPPPPLVGDSWKMVRVRGPLTAKVAGLGDDCIGTDGAILLAGLPALSPVPEGRRNGVVFMPHHKLYAFAPWKEACRRAGVEFLDPRSDSRYLLNRIRESRLVLSDAMHAAICADTMRVPWVPLSSSPNINSFKWLDWTMSLSIPYDPVQLPALDPRTKGEIATERWLRHGYRVDPPTQEKVLTHILGSASHSGRPTPLALRVRRKLISSGVEAWSGSTARLFRQNGRIIDKGADALRQLSSANGQLSSDRSFKEALELMQDALRSVLDQLATSGAARRS